MGTTFSHLKVFIASPGDVQEERGIVREVCEKLSNNPIIKKESLFFDAQEWEEVFPIMFYFKEIGNLPPEEFINDMEQLKGVFDLRKKIERENILLYGTFDIPNTFREKLSTDLEGWIATHAKKAQYNQETQWL